MAVEKVVILRGWNLLTPVIRDDRKAEAAGIKPGMMCVPGTAPKTIKVGPAAATAKVGIYALERDEGGNDLEVAYALGDNVKYVPHVSGVTLNLLVKGGIAAAEGAAYVSNGDGTLQANTGAALDAVVGYGEEAITNTANAKRVAVRLA
jgi:hypothetical protein